MNSSLNLDQIFSVGSFVRAAAFEREQVGQDFPGKEDAAEEVEDNQHDEQRLVVLKGDLLQCWLYFDWQGLLHGMTVFYSELNPEFCLDEYENCMGI